MSFRYATIRLLNVMRKPTPMTVAEVNEDSFRRMSSTRQLAVQGRSRVSVTSTKSDIGPTELLS